MPAKRGIHSGYIFGRLFSAIYCTQSLGGDPSRGTRRAALPLAKNFSENEHVLGDHSLLGPHAGFDDLSDERESAGLQIRPALNWTVEEFVSHCGGRRGRKSLYEHYPNCFR